MIGVPKYDKKINQKKKKARSTSLLNIKVKISNEILANKILPSC